jgi:hypothetical protein
MNPLNKSTIFALFIASSFSASAVDMLTIRQDPAQTGGVQIQTASTEKLGFYGTTPVVRPANTNTSRQALVALGLLTTGGADPADVFDLTVDNTLGDGVDMTFGAATGTELGTAITEKLAFHGSTPVIQRASANQTALTDNTGGSVANATLADGVTATALTDSGGGAAANGTIEAISVSRAGAVHYAAPDAATTSASATQLDIAAAVGGETMANLVQPDYPRNLVVNFTDGNASVSAFQLDIVGVGINGEAVTEQFLFAGGLDQTGSKIFSSITSVTLTSVAGNGAGDTLDLGIGSKLGVPVPVGAASLVIRRLNVDGAAEAAAATDQTNNSFTATTALNGTKDLDVMYNYADAADTALRSAVKELSTAVNLLIADDATQNDNDAKVAELANEIRAALVEKGLIKGSN